MTPARVAVLVAFCAGAVPAQDAPHQDAFEVLQPLPPGPRITPYLQYQLDEAWRQDDERQRTWAAIRSESELLKLQETTRQKLLQMIGGLPEERTDLHARITGKIAMDGYTIEKLIFESLPRVYVTALVYAPNDRSQKHPAVLVPAGHATNGKIHYQGLSQRLAARGYVVISWDAVGQGERSQFWNAKEGKSRYNLICGEHAVMGNIAYLAAANLARWEVWDGMRAVDYLLTRSDVDPARIGITGTSGGGTQTVLIAALDRRIKVAIPSCYISALPMRMANRIFADPDSDPEQDMYEMVSAGVDHAGLLLLMYPRPVMVASAVLDFFPIEGARRTFREVQRMYERFSHADRIAMAEGYHGHAYSTENQEAALDFLDRFNHMPKRHGLVMPKELPDADLLCTSSGQVMVDQKDARSLMDVIREYYEEHKAERRQSLQSDYRKREKNSVATRNVAEFSGTPPNKREILWESRGRTQINDVVLEKFLLRYNRTLEMPLLYLHQSEHRGGNERREVLLWSRANGKAGAADWPELLKHITAGYDIVTFDFRGLGETRMPFTAVSPDDPASGKLDFDQAYSNPISGVLANYVYNSLLIGRPYLLQMIEDAAVAQRFTNAKLHTNVTAITSPDNDYTTEWAIAQTVPGIKLLTPPNAKIVKWQDLVEEKQEVWPIQLLLPGGAYLH